MSTPVQRETDGGALTDGELAAEQANELPDREAMSLVDLGDNVAVPINEATAINYGSDYAVAVADADQVVFVDQTDVDPDGTTTDTTSNGWKGGKNG